MKFDTICSRLLFWIILPLMVVYLVMSALEIKLGRDAAIKEKEAFLLESTSKHAAECDYFLLMASETARTYARQLTLEAPNSPEEILQFGRKCLEDDPQFLGVLVAFEPDFFAGKHLCGPMAYRETVDAPIEECDLADRYDYTTWDWYLLCSLTDKEAWADPYSSGVRADSYLVSFSSPFFRNGKFAGVVSVDVSLETIRDFVSKIRPDGATYRLVNSTGTILSAPEKDLEMHHTVFSLAQWYGSRELENMGRDIVQGRSGTSVFDWPVDGQKTWFVHSPLKETGWSLLASIPEATILWPVYRRGLLNLAIFSCGLLTIVAIITVVSVRLTEPLRDLSRFSKELAQGRFDAPPPKVRRQDEIGRLSQNFAKMAVDLEQYLERSLQEESARKLLEGELQVARRIQESLQPHFFPPFPDRKEFSLYAVNEPAKFMAGDFFDFFLLEENKLVLLIADVSGKGVPAAIFMAVTRTAIRNITFGGLPPTEVLQRLNTSLAMDNEDAMFVTLFYAQYDTETGVLTYVNAGHNPPYVIKPDGSYEALKATGPLAGVLDDARYTESVCLLEPGDLLVAFTDGITEAYWQSAKDLYGEERLEKFLLELRGDPIEKIVQKTLVEVDRFSHGERHDDITMLLLRREQ